MPIDSPLKRRFHLVDGTNSYADAMTTRSCYSKKKGNKS